MTTNGFFMYFIFIQLVTQIPPIIVNGKLICSSAVQSPVRKKYFFISSFARMLTISTVWVFAFVEKPERVLYYQFTEGLYAMGVGILLISPYMFYLFRNMLKEETASWRGEMLGMNGQWKSVTNRVRLNNAEPLLDLHVITLVDLIQCHQHVFIDFAFVKVFEELGSGATASVFRGLYRWVTLCGRYLV